MNTKLQELVVSHMKLDSYRTVAALLPEVLNGATFTEDDIFDTAYVLFLLEELVLQGKFQHLGDNVYRLLEGHNG